MTYDTSKLLHQLYVGLHGLRKAFVKPQFYLFSGSTGTPKNLTIEQKMQQTRLDALDRLSRLVK